MAYNQKQNAGRGNMPKTGRDIPLNMKSQTGTIDDPVDKQGEYPSLNELKARFKDKTVLPKKNKENEYSLIDKSGNSVSYKSSPKKEYKELTSTEFISNVLKNKKTDK